MLKNELTIIFNEFQKGNALNEKVSTGTVFWHLEHTLKVIVGIVSSLRESDENAYSYQWNLKRLILFKMGFFPRGVGKSPKVVLPATKEGSSEEIKALLEQIQLLEKDWVQLSSKKWFLHVYFGRLNKARAHRFLKIHTKHHLKIIRDIRQKEL